MTVLTVSAAALVAFRPNRLWPFLLLAVGTEAAVLGAGRADGSTTTSAWSVVPTSRW